MGIVPIPGCLDYSAKLAREREVQGAHCFRSCSRSKYSQYSPRNLTSHDSNRETPARLPMLPYNNSSKCRLSRNPTYRPDSTSNGTTPPSPAVAELPRPPGGSSIGLSSSGESSVALSLFFQGQSTFFDYRALSAGRVGPLNQIS